MDFWNFSGTYLMRFAASKGCVSHFENSSSRHFRAVFLIFLDVLQFAFLD